MIYFENYVDTSQLNTNYIIRKRNEIGQTYIPGPRDGSFMSTAISLIEPEFQTVNLDGRYAIETRGLWETKGDYMGGPFISYSIVDEENNRIITVEGYVYFPNTTKRILLHQVDAIIRSLKILD